MSRHSKIKQLNDAHAPVYDAIAELPFYREHLAILLRALAPEPNGIYIDIGCGTGNFMCQEGTSEASFFGLDRSLPMLRQGAAKGLRLIAADVEQLPFRNASVDGAVCVNLLWQLSKDSRLADEILRVLKPGALLVLSTPSQSQVPHDKRFAAAMFAGMLRRPELASRADIVGALAEYGRLNKEIVELAEQPFLDLEALTGYLSDFELISEQRVYADQNLMICARKPGAGSKPAP